jgi:predicted DNA-binding transcriptional regulator AlpA
MVGRARNISSPGILDEFLDEDQCAASLGLSPITLSRWRMQRKGPPFTKIGRRILYSRGSVRAWVAAQEQRVEHPKQAAARRTKAAAREAAATSPANATP